jgi:membrane fusion protein (multidrug efflux system)
MKLNSFLLSIGIVAAFASCSRHKEHHKETLELEATKPLIIDTTIVNKFVCQIKSIRHIELRSLEKGYLEKIFVDEGQFVKKGQLLFQIQPAVYEAESNKCKAELQAAKIELDNIALLAKKNIVSENELALAKAKYAKAQSELSVANTHLQFTRIYAPFDGIVGLLEKKLGSAIDEGELITSLSDNSDVWVYFNVPEVDYLNYKTDTTNKVNSVSLELANRVKYPYPGIIDAIEADFNNETGNIAFRATFPNKDQLLRNGETGNILMEVPVKKAIIIPQKATFEILDKKYVYTVDENKIAHLTPITVLAELPDLFLVASGLKGNETFILEGIRKVQDKDSVNIKFTPTKVALSKLQVASE